MLRAAREAQGISQREMADRLNWMPNYVAAIEDGEFGVLRGQAFVKGYIRAYGKQVGIAEAELLAAYALQEPQPGPAELAPKRRQVRRPQLQKNGFGVPVGVAIVVLLGVGLWWWQDGANAPAEEQPFTALKGTVTADAQPGAEPGSAAVNPTANTTAIAATAKVSESIELSAEPGAEPEVQMAAPGEETEAPGMAAGVVTAPAMTGSASAVSIPGLGFVFKGQCWVEVRDASGDLIFADLRNAGDVLALGGSAPFDVLLGDARQVELRYQGEPVEIVSEPGRVKARFTVGEL
jgi:cytoskeleton protein RodZ